MVLSRLEAANVLANPIVPRGPLLSRQLSIDLFDCRFRDHVEPIS